MKNYLVTIIVGFLMFILGMYILNYTNIGSPEIPTVVAGLGACLVVFQILQYRFKKGNPRHLFCGLIFIFLPLFMVWKTSASPLVLFTMVIGLLLIGLAYTKKYAPAAEENN